MSSGVPARIVAVDVDGRSMCFAVAKASGMVLSSAFCVCRPGGIEAESSVSAGIHILKQESKRGLPNASHQGFDLPVPGCLSSLMLLAPAATATVKANYYELLRRVPDSANTIILIDVERLLMSPIAMKEKWRDKANSADGRALHFPINAERYMLASKLDFVSNFDDLWDIALIETSEPVSLPYLAKAEGGYLDKLDGQEVAYSPRNAFLVSFKPTILDVSFPANRQDLGRWLRSLQRHREATGLGIPSKCGDARARQGSHGHRDGPGRLAARLAMVRERLHRAESLAGKQVDLDAFTRILTSMKGVTLTVEATDRLHGKIKVDLGESPTPIKNVARVFMLEVLEKNGMLLDEMKEWRLLSEAKAVVLEGRLTTKGLRTLTDLIPCPAQTLDLKGAESKGNEASPASANSSSDKDAKVTASKKYFQHISQLLDDLRTEVRGAQKAKFAQMMLNKAALEIDRLPVLNVDEELLAYGAGVSSSLRGMRNLSKNADLDFRYRQAGIQGNSGAYGYGYGYGGFYGGGGSTALASEVTHTQETMMLKSNELRS